MPSTASPQPEPVQFENVTASSGIHYRWPQQPHPMDILQSFGCGCAFLDYDNDGWQDILLIGEPHPVLYRNLGNGRFEDVTEKVGLAALQGDWRGCAVGDYDNDGYLDLLLTGYRSFRLLHNDGGRRWKDATRDAGLDSHNGGRWGSSAGFMDLDGDGLLDLVILNYVRFGPGMPRFCQWKPGLQSGCGPAQYAPEYPELWKNLGAGRFKDVTRASGLTASYGKSMVLAFADVNADGRPDLFVGNDGRPSELWQNQGGMRFVEVGQKTGVAYGSVPGEAISAMGADWGDFDGDGRLDLVVTSYSNQPYSLLQSLGGGMFQHAGDATGLSTATYKSLGFGAKWVDMDNDGWPDLAFANGHVHDNTEQIDPSTHYREPLMLFHNQAGRQFVNVRPSTGHGIGAPIVGRGLATGDFDNDGRVDILAVDYEGEPQLLHNSTPTGNHWLTLDLRTGGKNRFAYGASVIAHAGKHGWAGQVTPASSYLSSSDPRVHLGLGPADRLESITITWPSGKRETVRNVAADRLVVVEEGRAAVIAIGRARQ